MNTMVELSPVECLELLDTVPIGRIGVTTPQGPRIVPVNFVRRDHAVYFRTAAYSELATYARGAGIAFEIDHLDLERERGWSVVALGTCTEVDDPAELRRLSSEGGPLPWAGGVRPMMLRLEWRTLSGRRVGGAFWPHPATPRSW